LNNEIGKFKKRQADPQMVVKEDELEGYSAR